MSKILNEKQHYHHVVFHMNGHFIKTVNKWLILFLCLSMLVSCQQSCQDKPELNTYNCNKHRSGEFAACIKKNFPMGSSYLELSKYLTNMCFWKSNLPEDINKNHFYFKWSANNLSNYEVAVAGNYDFNLKITRISIDPDPSLDIYGKPLSENQKRIQAKNRLKNLRNRI